MSRDVASQRFARARAGRIRDGIHHYLDTLSTITEAWRERDWEALGYVSWDAYVDSEFGAERLRLPAEHRRKAIEELRLAGMSQRAIASAVGANRETVIKDIRESQVVGNQPPGEVTGTDGKTYPAARPAPEFTTPPELPVSSPPQAEPEQAPLVAAMRTAIEDAAERATERERERPPKWDPEERRRHEEEVRRIQDIESARRTAQTIVTEVRSLVVTVVTGSRYGERGLVTKEMVQELHRAIDLLEGEL